MYRLHLKSKSFRFISHFKKQCRFVETTSTESPQKYQLSKDEIHSNKFLSVEVKYNIGKYNQTPIANIPVESPMTHGMIFIQAGARNEPLQFLGASHILSHSILNGTNKTLMTDVVRSLQSLGANIKCLNDRDSIMVYVNAHPDHMEYCLNTVYEGLYNNANKYHEFKYSFDSCLIDYDNFKENFPHAYLMEYVHNFAFRDGLGNSLFLNPSVITRVEDYFDMMNEYRRQVFTSNGCMTSIGYLDVIPDLVFYMNTGSENDRKLYENPLYTPKALPKFYSGELRVPYHHRRTYVTITYPGSAKYGNDYWLFLLFQKYIANPSEYSYFPCPNYTLFDKLVSQQDYYDGYQTVIGYNMCYKDTGLFGISMAAFHDSIHQLVSTVTQMLNKLKSNPVVSDESFRCAKAAAKLEFLSNLESKENFLRDLSFQLCNNDSQYISPVKRMDAIDKISKKQFEEFIKRTLSKKPIFAVLGDIRKVRPPTEYIDV